MKVDLLRKVRKRYSIIYYPNGFGYYSDTKIMILFDNDDVSHHINVNDVNTIKVAYDVLFKILLEKIVREYRKYGTRRLDKNGKVQKLWHKLN